jgi:hypothetical protein
MNAFEIVIVISLDKIISGSETFRFVQILEAGFECPLCFSWWLQLGLQFDPDR